MNDREEKFEKMLKTVQTQYTNTIEKMNELKAAGKEKTVTYKQLMSSKLTLINMLSMYQAYGLIDKI